MDRRNYDPPVWSEQTHSWSDEPVNGLICTLAGTALIVVLVIGNALLSI